MATKKGFIARVWKWTKRVFIFLFLFQLFYIILLRWVDPPITLTQLESVFAGHGLRRDYVRMKNISPYAKLAVISAEDQIFPDHNGFDWKSIKKAIAKNTKAKGKYVRGGSTISQQVAKNVFLWQGKSMFRKGLEAYFTFMIELIWGKKRILEMYLNVSEMGKGIFGVEAAARRYFYKSSRYLTRKEAAMIASGMPNPKKYTVKPLSKAVAQRYPWVMQQMKNLQDDPELQSLIQ